MKTFGIALLTIAMVMLALFGVWINMNLTRKHTSNAAGPELFADVCAPEKNPAYDCDVVMNTKWAVFSPATFSFVEPDPETGTQNGMPVAMIGLFYFTALMVWFAAIGRPSGDRRIWHWVPTLTVGAGCAASVFFLYILMTQLETKCIWCMVSHGINFLLLIGTLILWPRKPAERQIPPNAETKKKGKARKVIKKAVEAGAPVLPQVVWGHPTFRLVCVAGVCTIAFMYAEYSLAVGDKYRYEAKVYREQLDKIAKDTDTQLAQFQGQKKVKLEVRSDDPRQGKDESLLQMVVFSDLQCPACRKFAKEFEEKIKPGFGNMLQVVWKHYPICQDCNPYVSHNLHPQACEAAYAAEAARAQGGKEAFWKAHDEFFNNPSMFKKDIDWRKLAEELSLDPDRFVADMQSEAIKKRVREDIDQGKRLEIKFTPTIFLGGRKVRRYMLNNKLFVEAIKKRFVHQRKTGKNHRHKH